MWGFLVFLVGILYGWMTPGRQDKTRLFMNGLWIGLVLAIVLALLGVLLSAPAVPLGVNVVGVVLSVLLLTVLFIVGAWLGDLIEGSRRHAV